MHIAYLRCVRRARAPCTYRANVDRWQKPLSLLTVDTISSSRRKPECRNDTASALVSMTALAKHLQHGTNNELWKLKLTVFD